MPERTLRACQTACQHILLTLRETRVMTRDSLHGAAGARTYRQRSKQ
jgi:hypothetical protein